MANGHAQTKKGKKRGEIFQIRSGMRTKYPGWHTNLNTIKAALRTKHEWAGWAMELLGERQEKLKKNRELKQERKEQGARAEKKKAGKATRKTRLAKRTE